MSDYYERRCDELTQRLYKASEVTGTLLGKATVHGGLTEAEVCELAEQLMAALQGGGSNGS